MRRNERPLAGYHILHTEHFCPFCRIWCINWGGESTYRNRTICASCSWYLGTKGKQ